MLVFSLLEAWEWKHQSAWGIGAFGHFFAGIQYLGQYLNINHNTAVSDLHSASCMHHVWDVVLQPFCNEFIQSGLRCIIMVAKAGAIYRTSASWQLDLWIQLRPSVSYVAIVTCRPWNNMRGLRLRCYGYNKRQGLQWAIIKFLGCKNDNKRPWLIGSIYGWHRPVSLCFIDREGNAVHLRLSSLYLFNPHKTFPTLRRSLPHCYGEGTWRLKDFSTFCLVFCNKRWSNTHMWRLIAITNKIDTVRHTWKTSRFLSFFKRSLS